MTTTTDIKQTCHWTTACRALAATDWGDDGDCVCGDDDDDDDDDDDALLASIILLLLTLAQTSVQPQKPPFLMTAPLQSRRG